MNTTQKRSKLTGLGIAVLMLSFIFTEPIVILAFKPKTHVWIAQQILNDVVPDGKLTINGKEYEVDEDVLKALRNHPNEYRMGFVGPDAFPDPLVGQITVHPGNPKKTEAWQSDRWLLEMLKAAGSDAQMKSFAYGYFGHASGDIFAHTYVNTYAGDIFLLAEGYTPGKDRRQFSNEEKRHFALEDFIAKYTPPIVDESNNPLEISTKSLNVPADKLAKFLILNNEVAEQYRGVNETRHEENNQDLMSTTLTGHLLLMKLYRDKVSDMIFNPKQSSTLYERREKIKNLQNDRTNETVELEKTTRLIAEEKSKISLLEPQVNSQKDEKSREDLEQAKNTLKTIERTQKSQQERISKLDSEIKSLEKKEYKHLRELKAWLANIDLAIASYIEMSIDVGIELTKDKGHPMEPVKNWRKTKSRLFFPPKIEGKIKKLQEIEAAIRKLPGIKEAIEKIESLEKRIARILSVALGNLFLGPQIAEVLKIILGEDEKKADKKSAKSKAEVNKEDEARLSRIFIDKSGKDLLDIPDIAARVKADMKLKGEYFDSERFSAVYNSIVLAKLTLLRPGQLNQLVRNYYDGAPDIFFESANFNILNGAVRSIDGNHQWSECAPPYLRKQRNFGKYSDGYINKNRYGYKNGFALWADPLIREKVFRKIFRGPLVPAMETSEELGFISLIPPNYLFYRPSAENPFPNIEECDVEVIE